MELSYYPLRFVIAIFWSVIFLPSTVLGQWIEEPGKGWFQLSLYHHDTTNRFDAQGSLEPLFNDEGRSITSSLILTGVIGVHRGIDLWAQVPLHRLEFNDIASERESFGFGDPIFYVRLGPSLLGLNVPVPIALRGGVKFSIGDFPVDSEIVPLTEGQRDWEAILEIGHSFYPAPLYMMAWAGYRWRETNHEIERKPGDERFFYTAIGGVHNRINWKLAVEGLLGKKWVSFTGAKIRLDKSERELLQLQPSVGWLIGKGNVELGLRIPLAGRNFPAGPALFVGYFYSWKG